VTIAILKVKLILDEAVAIGVCLQYFDLKYRPCYLHNPFTPSEIMSGLL